MNDDQDGKTGQEDEDISAEVVDIDAAATAVGLRSGDEYDKDPKELNTAKDLDEDEKNDWQS